MLPSLRRNLLVICAAVVVGGPGAWAATPTTIVVQATPVASQLSQPVTLTATVTPVSATGKVTFYDETAILGSATLTNGTAVLSTIGIGYGTRHLKARYVGDANNASSLSAAVVETVSTRPGGAFVQTAGPLSYFGSNQIRHVTIADLNHDGHPDLVTTNENYPNITAR